MGESENGLDGAKTKSARRRGAPLLFGSLVLLLLSVLVALQLFGLWEVFTPDTASDTLLIYALSTLNFVAFFLFTFIFIRSLLKLRRERRERQLGSKIKTRLVVYFIAVSLLPITAMAVFSNMFFNRTLEKYFSNFPEGVVREALEAQQRDYQQQSEQLAELASLVAVQLDARQGEVTQEQLAEIADGHFAALALFKSDGGLAAEVVPARYENFRVGLDAALRETSGARATTLGGRTFDALVAPLGDGQRLVAMRERQQDANLSTLAVGAQRFENFKRGQRRVRLLGLTTLGLLTLLLLFAATWAAIHLARGIGTPIRALAEAADQVAGGNLEHPVLPVTADELDVPADASEGNGNSHTVGNSNVDGNSNGGFSGNNGGGVIPVALTATALAPRTDAARRGVVLVIEDLSELLAAQRAAAWSEVARRLAHEIKNPLTPIQLSAERIARNFRRAGEGLEAGADANGDGRGEEQGRVARVVEECTATISREVAGMKAMVDEFTRFARLPHARLEPGDLNEVLRQAVALYEDRLEGLRMDVLLARELPGAMLDAEQLRRVFVNLIDNSIEALAEVEGGRRITVATAHDPARGLLVAEVADTGHGIARSDFARLFQPYFSTRGRGTGLGLAIVHRIMAEHGGRIRAESNRPRGARMIIELPVAEDRQAEARP